MTYNDIKQRVYDLLDMPVSEALALGYSKKICRIFNEATFRIAHSLLPNLRAYEFHITADKFPIEVTMPPDFISFAHEQNAYVNGKNFVLTRFAGKSGIILTGEEGGITDQVRKYIIYYNAVYPEIIDGGLLYKYYKLEPVENADSYSVVTEPTETMHNDTDVSMQWPDIIGHLVPHYIVSQLLSRDDKVRSIEELNIFERLLATVNVDRNERQRTYHSVRGWY